MQTDVTLFSANNSQHCWMLHVASVCTPCCMLLRVVGSSCIRLHTSVQQCWELLHLLARGFHKACFWCKLLITVNNIKCFKNILWKKSCAHVASEDRFYTIKRFVFFFSFFPHSMLNIPIIVCLIHVPAYAKLVGYSGNGNTSKGDRAAFAVRF